MTPKRLQRNHPIRPAPPRETACGRSGAAGLYPPSPIPMPAKRRGPQTTLACDACRTRKTKCDGLRPCEACRAKNLQCHYDKEGREKNKTSVLRSQVADLRAVVKRILEASDEDAVEIKRRLRDSFDVPKVVREFCTSSSSLVEQADYDYERSASPESMVAAGCRLPAIDFLPVGNTREQPQTHTPTRLELFKLARQRAMLDAVSLDANDDNGGELAFSLSIPQTSYFPTSFQQIPLVRRPSKSIRDSFKPGESKAAFPFLLIVSPPQIPVSEAYVSRLACLWLSYHAFLTPYIQPTEFVSSFDTCDNSSRSDDGPALLQNAVLALSCFYLPRSSIYEPEQPESLARHFSTEVENLSRFEKSQPSLAQIQGLLARYDFEKLSGRDSSGWKSLNAAVDICQDIGLNSVHGNLEDQRVSDAEAFTAWGIFCHQAIESLTYCKPPQLLRCWTERPKKITPSRITDLWRAYCLSDHATNSSFWDHWEALCDLSDIIVDATYVLYGDQIDGFEIPNRVLVAQTQQSRQRLDEWRRNLPSTLSLTSNESPHNLWLHMAYYSLTIALHRPYITQPSISESEPRDVVMHSRTIMIEAARSIVRLASISLEKYTPSFSPAHNLSMVGTAAFLLVDDLNDAESRSNLLEALAILQLQSHRFSLAAALARAIPLVCKLVVVPGTAAAADIEAILVAEDYASASNLRAETKAGSPSVTREPSLVSSSSTASLTSSYSTAEGIDLSSPNTSFCSTESHSSLPQSILPRPSSTVKTSCPMGYDHLLNHNQSNHYAGHYIHPSNHSVCPPRYSNDFHQINNHRHNRLPHINAPVSRSSSTHGSSSKRLAPQINSNFPCFIVLPERFTMARDARGFIQRCGGRRRHIGAGGARLSEVLDALDGTDASSAYSSSRIGSSTPYRAGSGDVEMRL